MRATVRLGSNLFPALLLAAAGCHGPGEAGATAPPGAPPSSGSHASTPRANAPASSVPLAPAPTPPADAPPGGGSGSGTGTGRGQGGQRFRQAGVYLDGTPLAVLKFGELPPGLRTTWHERTTSEGEKLRTRRFLLADYLEALGVDLKKLDAVHIYGGRRRVGVLPGAELLRLRAEVAFSFTQSDAGKPRMHWPTEIAVTDKIDMVGDLALYAEKAPPAWNVERSQLEIGGQPVDGIPYATVELRGGTRLYVDGRLARTIRAQALGPPTGDPPRWSLAAQLATAGVPLDQVQVVELVENDAVHARIERAALPTATFDVTPQSHGRVFVHPGALPAEALLVYVKTTPVPAGTR